jgi:hypothetical protein
MLLALLACDTPAPATPDEEAAACGDWDTVGAPYVTTWCASCHSARLGEGARYGAPVGLDLADLDGVRANATAARAAVERGSMPPTGGPSEAETARFLAWLACDAPGEGVALPLAAPPERVYGGSWEVWNDVTVEDDFPEGLTLTATRIGLGVTTATGVMAAERYTVTDTEAWLVERARYDEDGATLFVDTWEPPLRVLTDLDEWDVRTTRTHDTPDGTFVREETWRFTQSADPAPDGRLLGPDMRSIAGFDAETGAEISYTISAARGVDARRFADVGDFADPEGAVFDVRQFSAMPRGFDLPAFPLADGQHANAGVLLWEPL